MKMFRRGLHAAIITALLMGLLHAQAGETNEALKVSLNSCRIVQMMLGARGQGKDIPKDDDFALAGKNCSRLQEAASKSDDGVTQSEMADLRKILARLGMPPATLKEQLAAAESSAAKLSGRSLFYELNSLAKRAFEAGEIEKASAYAKQLGEMAPKYRDDWNYGNAIFDSNLVKGRIALRQGDTKAAGEYLLAAGSTPGSPQLDSFVGPSMVLAKELLEHGQSDVVLKFFALCKKFWADDSGKLDQWTGEVRGGKVPDFGASLSFPVLRVF